ncbi:ATP-binding SpoIIE family protein phosphatase [Zavarzinella formosa]|uniref:ATP-binding SpoIIE family protein phosphatase n=1 Tax=Zavarzinella formosa TaxID=360055 RepID=UPI00037E075E|nr:ATP-binding SpoIIE family protein phosphatase [Zavarzinella formosa]
MPDQTVVHVTEASQVGEARRTAVRMAEAAGLGETARGNVAIIVTELANNLARYAREGRVLLQTLPGPGGGAIIEIITLDRGPGMPDVGRCMTDGYSTGGTPGNGLGAVRRLSHEFDIDSTIGAGTVILSRIGNVSKTSGAARQNFQWGTISLPAPRETVCGDTWRIEETEAEIRVMIADGLGHGPLAHEAAETAGKAFDQPDSHREPAMFLERTHPKLTATRGAAIAIGRCVIQSSVFTYAGVGNIAGTLLNNSERRGLVSQNGTLGAQMRTVRPNDYQWPTGWLLVMHSDGMQSRWTINHQSGLFSRHPAVIAAVLARDFGRGPDDLTVVVIRRLETQA